MTSRRQLVGGVRSFVQQRSRVHTLATATQAQRGHRHRVEDGRAFGPGSALLALLAAGAGVSLLATQQLRADSRVTPSSLRKISGDEIAKHAAVGDCWVVINDLVYNVSDFVPLHPGGGELIVMNGGKDVTKLFQQLHPKGTLERSLPPEKAIGRIDPSSRPAVADTGEDEDELDERRAQLPPLHAVVNLRSFEELARTVIGEDSRPYNFITSYADDGDTYRATRASFGFIRFVPRVNVPVGEISPAAVFLGKKAAAPIPIILSPTGQNRNAHPEGEFNALHAAAATGVPQVLSNASSIGLDEMLQERQRIADETKAPLAPLWWQLYIRRDRKMNERQIQEAARGKVDAIVITVDAPTLGNREADKSHPEKQGMAAPVSGMRGLVPLAPGALDPNLSWDDVAWVKRNAPGIPVLVKGVASVDDVELAYKAGAAGVILSNHGGRQLNYAPPPLATLARIQRERPDLLRSLEVYIDGGVTRGTDVLKALCLGAKGVGLGRVPLYAQACYGEEGITRALQILSDEIYTGMRLLGARNLGELRPEMVEIMPGLLGERGRSH